MALNEQQEDIAMMIISNAGAARGAAFEALKEAKACAFHQADETMKTADDYTRVAHKAHSELLAMYAKGQLEGSDILLSHAQDHLMCAELAKELITEMIALRRERADQDGKGGKDK